MVEKTDWQKEIETDCSELDLDGVAYEIELCKRTLEGNENNPYAQMKLEKLIERQTLLSGPVQAL